MTDSEFLDKHFYDKFYNLNEETILELNKAWNDPRINNVVSGIHSHCYGLALIDDSKSIKYQVHYINGVGQLAGNLLELNISDPERDRLLLIFSMHLADNYNLDALETFNTYQDATRSMCEQLGYMTITSNELLPYKDNNPSIIAKNVKGIMIVPFLYHADLFKFIFDDLPIIAPEPGDSYVYLMHNKRNNLIKIGKSRNPRFREKTLQAEEPEILMIAVWKASDKLERYLHRLYKHQRLRGEWFSLTFKELKEIKFQVDKFMSQPII